LRRIGRSRLGDREDRAEPGDGAVAACELQTRCDVGTPVGVGAEAEGEEIGRRAGEPDPRLAARLAELAVAHGELEPAFVDDDLVGNVDAAGVGGVHGQEGASQEAGERWNDVARGRRLTK
jgi:hypothetical protein